MGEKMFEYYLVSSSGNWANWAELGKLEMRYLRDLILRGGGGCEGGIGGKFNPAT